MAATPSRTLACPQCHQRLAVPASAALRVGRCPRCGTNVWLDNSPPPLPAVSLPPAVASVAAESAVDPQLASFLAGQQQPVRPTSTLGTTVRPRRRQKQKLSKPVVMAASFLVVVLALAIWEINAARAVSEFKRSIGATTANSNVTLAAFYRLRPGMSYSQVVSIVGADGNLAGQNQFDMPSYDDGQLSYDKLDTRSYTWSGSRFGVLDVMFQNDRLINKAQFGLR